MTAVLAAADPSAAATSASIAQLTDELRVLETERDEAVKTAESCARTSVRLEEMVLLLDKLALEKIKEGDEEGARQVLQEKASTKEVLDKTNSRAQVNYTLASKLADKIGRVQRRLVDMLSPTGSSQQGHHHHHQQQQQQYQQGGQYQQQQQQPQQQQQQQQYGGGVGYASGGNVAYGATSASYSASGTAGRAGGFASTSSYAPRRPDWEVGLEVARDRIRRAEEAAAAEGRRPAWQARESIEEARERLRREAQQGVAEAQRRVRGKATESIAEARARIAAEDQAVLAKVQALMARYRRGEYVSEDDLEWAFRQLERRFLM